MLSVMGRLGRNSLEWIAIAPEKGPLAEELARQNLTHHPMNFHDSEGARLPLEGLLSNLTSVVSEISPDLLHANSLSMGRLTGKIAGEIDCPASAHLRDIIKLNRNVIQDLNANRKLIAVSKATRDFHVGQGLDPEKVEVIYNGVNCELFSPSEPTGNLKEELNLPEDAFTALTIGQIGLRKGQDTLASAAIKAIHDISNLHVIIAGERNSQKEESILFEKRIPEIFSEHGMQDKLHLIGYRNDIHEILNEVDLVIHSAYQEPLGRVLLEAGACGKAIIATDVGGTTEILENDVSGKLIPPGQSEVLADVLVELANDPEKRESLGREARQKIQSEFSIETASENLSCFFKQVSQ